MIKTRRTKRTFSPEFKLEAIEQVVKYQRDVREVAQALELNPDPLRKWIRLYKQELQGIEPAGNAITPEQREIQQLKAQIKQHEGAPGPQQKLRHIPYPACSDLRRRKRHRLPVSVRIEPAGGPRQMNMAVPVELPTKGVQCPKDTHGQPFLLHGIQQIVSGQGEQCPQEPAVGLSGTRAIMGAIHRLVPFFPQVGHPRTWQL